ncbi:MAG: hypothetical protein DIU76_09720 [Bacillota bacterium]|nr:MAG: hypothetical protein DIU76_09720 [Bacillota bacterium]
MYKRIATVLAAAALTATGLLASPASAANGPRPYAAVPNACGPLTLVNPAKNLSQFRYRVTGSRRTSVALVPERSTVRRDLRSRLGDGPLVVYWQARHHDHWAKAKAVRAAEKALTDAIRERDAAKAARDEAEKHLPRYKRAETWEAERTRLQSLLDRVDRDRTKREIQEKIAKISAYLDAEKALNEAEAKVDEARAELERVKAAAYWTRWRGGVLRVDECARPTPSPSPTETGEPVEPTPTPEPSKEPTSTPEPSKEPTSTPEPTGTTDEDADDTVTGRTRVVVVNRVPVPVRVDTGLGGTAA